MPTTRSRAIIVVVIAVTIGALLFQPLAGAVADNTGEDTATNETFSADVDADWIDLSWYNIIENSETVEVYNDTDGSWTVVTDTEYEMDYDGGAISLDNTSAAYADGDDMRASYDFERTSGMTTQVATLAPLFLALLLLVVLASRAMELM